MTTRIIIVAIDRLTMEEAFVGDRNTGRMLRRSMRDLRLRAVIHR
jgi:hypothetical protein